MVGFLSNTNTKVKNIHERGIEKTRKGDMQGALKDFSEVIKLDPKHADAYFRRGYLLMRNGDLTGAAHDYMHALKLDPNHANAAMMKEMLKRAQEMITRKNPPAASPAAPTPAAPPAPTQTAPSPSVSAEQGFVDSQISAAPSMAAAADTESITPEVFIQRGIELYESDLVEEAIDTFIEALKIDPDNADAYINLGAIYHHYDEDELAHEYFKTALNLAPNHPDAARMRELLRITEEGTRTRRGLLEEKKATPDNDDLPVVPE